MAIIALKAWYLPTYEPLADLEARPHDLRLNKNSLLKSALRADFLDDADEVKRSAWFQRYLVGEVVEFYIEGSGGYSIANIDLRSHEIYFTKRDLLARHDPTIFLCYQTEYPESSEILHEELETALDKLNGRSRLPISLKLSHRLSDSPIRLDSALMRALRQSLLLVADATAIAAVDSDIMQLLPSPKVCVEVGYALQCKPPEQILIFNQERADLPGQFPFDLASDQRIGFKDRASLRKLLPQRLITHLAPFHLFE
jgi:hypothetical protein